MRTEMDMMIGGIAPLERPETKGVEKAGQASFSDTFGKAVGELDKLQVEADQQARLVADGAGNLHEVAIALEKADVGMRLAMKVRNKIVEAYNEIMRMGV